MERKLRRCEDKFRPFSSGEDEDEDYRDRGGSSDEDGDGEVDNVPTLGYLEIPLMLRASPQGATVSAETQGSLKVALEYATCNRDVMPLPHVRTNERS